MFGDICWPLAIPGVMLVAFVAYQLFGGKK